MLSPTDVKTILDGLKLAADVETKAKLAEVSAAYSQAVCENFDLVEENRKLREELARKKALEVIGGAAYVLEADGAKTGPVCPACYADGITVILESAAKGGAQCSKCKARYAGVRASIEGPRLRVG